MNRLTLKLILQSRYWLLFICLHSNFFTNAQSFVNIESGALYTIMNDVRNGSNGTLFSFKNDFQTPVSPFLRLRAGYLSNGKDHFSILYAKIRDAGVSLKNKELFIENFNIGFAPLFNFITNWDISQKMGVDVFGEGIAASKGRAIDLALSGRYSITKNFQGNIGYRLLEGGANGTNRYNFIQLHFFFASVNYIFDKNK